MFETLDLVRNHTHARIEIIVVDDDSIDKTAPLDRRQVANELRRRLMGAFVGRGIRPYADRR